MLEECDGHDVVMNAAPNMPHTASSTVQPQTPLFCVALKPHGHLEDI
jgi:hypothetical protein